MTGPPLPEPLDPESTEPVDPWADWADAEEDDDDRADDWDDGFDPYEWLSQDPVLPRPAAVPCEHPLRCQWRAYPDTERWIRCGTHGCGVEYDLAADEDEDWLTQDTARHIRGDDDGTAEASRWHPVRTISVAGGVL